MGNLAFQLGCMGSQSLCMMRARTWYAFVSLWGRRPLIAQVGINTTL
jgi:hypothetical protein